MIREAIVQKITEDEKNLFDSIRIQIEKHSKVSIFTHRSPDGDCYGSGFALKHYLNSTYPDKEVFVIGESVPQYLSFLGAEDAVTDDFIKQSLAIAVDTATVARIADQRYLTALYKIKIDHHLEFERYGDISWVKTSSSCCENVALMLIYWNAVILKNIAVNLLTGMATDNGRFMYRGVNSLTHLVAAYLIDNGKVNVTDDIFNRIYLKSINNLPFQAWYLQNIQISNGLAHIIVDEATMQKYNVNAEDCASWLINMANYEECPVWIQFIEITEGYRCEFRSRNYDVSNIARKFNGGGHVNAAGARAKTRTEIQAIINYIKTLNLSEFKA